MNTGRLVITTLKEVNKYTLEPTGATKPNVSSDPDYVPPIYDYETCPVPTTQGDKVIITHNFGKYLLGASIELESKDSDFIKNIINITQEENDGADSIPSEAYIIKITVRKDIAKSISLNGIVRNNHSPYEGVWIEKFEIPKNININISIIPQSTKWVIDEDSAYCLQE